LLSSICIVKGKTSAPSSCALLRDRSEQLSIISFITISPLRFQAQVKKVIQEMTNAVIVVVCFSNVVCNSFDVVDGIIHSNTVLNILKHFSIVILITESDSAVRRNI